MFRPIPSIHVLKGSPHVKANKEQSLPEPTGVCRMPGKELTNKPHPLHPNIKALPEESPPQEANSPANSASTRLLNPLIIHLLKPAPYPPITATPDPARPLQFHSNPHVEP